MANAKKKLTPKQSQFVKEYLVDLNATQAAIRAGYSKKTARFIATENLSKPNIQEAISRLKKERSKRTGVTMDRVIQELANIAFANMGDVAEWDNVSLTVKSSADLTPEQMASVMQVELSQGEDYTTVKVKQHPKLKALELLKAHLETGPPEHDLHAQGVFSKIAEALKP